jgi:hypothetical protein
MEIIVQFVNAEKSVSAEGLCRKKLESLGAKYDWVIRADVFFKEEKESEAAVAETISDLEIQLEKRKHTLLNR